MTPIEDPSDLAHYRRRRSRQARNLRMLNNLPLAHRLAADRAEDDVHRESLLGQAMVGLVEATDRFEAEGGGARFGAYAEPLIIGALDRTRDEQEVRCAQAAVADAISGQERVRTLAAFLDVPVDALVCGLMDVAARERVADRHVSFRRGLKRADQEHLSRRSL